MSVVTYVSEPQFYTPSDNPITWVVSYPISGTYNLSFETTVYTNNASYVVVRYPSCCRNFPRLLIPFFSKLEDPEKPTGNLLIG